ncbi:YfhE family protein [Ornithinibacillus gellani]|nr:YfhE family protein [Ornithinibacillus gellani]TQS70638.1 YfhE family protein [Ornithinibacillus gellani]
MVAKRKDSPEKFLNKTQEVLYQKEFKRANRTYEAASEKRNKS